jgi:pre-mRNA-processing factor SLU7
MQSTTETRSDRKQQRSLQEARQAGTLAPATDAVTGQLINPHNPEFLTKRPWYLSSGGDNDAAAISLHHQTDQRPDQDKRLLTLTAAEELLQRQRQQELLSDQFKVGQWVEALKRNKAPYRMCQIIKVHNTSSQQQLVDVKYEDGTVETKLPVQKGARVRRTATGNRTATDGGDTDYKTTFVSKRDPYHGYDREHHNQEVVRKYEQKLVLRRKLREQQEATKQKERKEKKKDGDNNESDGKASDDSDFNDSDVEGSDNDGDESDDEFVQRDEDDKVLTTRLARQGGVGGAQMKVTARNLRIREDTAKYLRNLDPNSAYYDPKSRSMRDNPHPSRVPGQETDYSGDNFIRISGDAVALAQQQLFAWDAASKLEEESATELHPLANPSQVELLQKQFQGQANALQIQAKRAILNKYGGAEHLDGRDGLASAVETSDAAKVGNKVTPDDFAAPVVDPVEQMDRQLRFGVSTKVEEYSRDGRILASPAEQPKQRKALVSKYEENVFINGHTTVWGSYFHKGAFTWGYADDHSLLKNSYCTGENGRIANDEAHAMQYGTGQAGSALLAQVRQMLPPKSVATSSNSGTTNLVSRSKLYGSADPSLVLDEGKVREALQKKDGEDRIKNSSKRKYNSIHAEEEMTAERMEAYRIQKMNTTDDPMARISSSDEVLDYK